MTTRKRIEALLDEINENFEGDDLVFAKKALLTMETAASFIRNADACRGTLMLALTDEGAITSLHVDPHCVIETAQALVKIADDLVNRFDTNDDSTKH